MVACLIKLIVDVLRCEGSKSVPGVGVYLSLTVLANLAAHLESLYLENAILKRLDELVNRSLSYGRH